MPDHEHGAGLEDAENRLQKTGFFFRIKMRRSFVDEEDARPAEKLAGKREPEAFARGEIADGFGQYGVEFARKRADDGIRSGGGERLAH